MKDIKSECKVAVIQASPVFFDKKATIDKTIALIEEASEQEVDVMLFPETFIPAYPRGLDFGFIIGNRTMAGREDFKKYYDAAIVVPSEDTKKIGEAVKKSGAYVAIGVTERDPVSCTLYCALLYFSPDGDLIAKHRKIKPTGSERLIWGDAHSDYLQTVDSPFGTIGGLICWENYMPLARMALYQKGVTLYMAPTADNREEWHHTIRHIALEGRCFVLSCNQYVAEEMIPKCFSDQAGFATLPKPYCRGGSAIIDPYGKYVAGPIWDEEGILYATLNMDAIPMSRMDFDAAGHYARPDIFDFKVNLK